MSEIARASRTWSHGGSLRRELRPCRYQLGPIARQPSLLTHDGPNDPGLLATRLGLVSGFRVGVRPPLVRYVCGHRAGAEPVDPAHGQHVGHQPFESTVSPT